MSKVFPMGVFKEKFPFRSVTVPVLLPLTKTVAPTIGSLVSMSKTHPDISISLFFMVAVFSELPIIAVKLLKSTEDTLFNSSEISGWANTETVHNATGMT